MLFDFLSLDFDGVVEFSFQMFDKVCGPERTTASQRTSQYPIVTTSQRHNDQRPPPLRLQDKDESLSTDELKTIVKSTADRCTNRWRKGKIIGTFNLTSLEVHFPRKFGR